jgi:uncharacterized membrane protein YjjB (DUF3815 family)
VISSPSRSRRAPDACRGALLGAAVAGGTALGLRVAEAFGVHLTILVAGQADWAFPVVVGAALLAVAAYAIQLGVLRNAVIQAALLGAVGWTLYLAATTGAASVDPAIATFTSAIVIGAAGRLLAHRQAAPAALFVVPAILPLLPGLILVRAMLAATDAARVGGLIDATATAFLVGTGVASGDIVVATVRRIQTRIVAPAVDAVSGGVDVLVVGPVTRALGARPGTTTRRPAPDGAEAEGAQGTLTGRSACRAWPKAGPPDVEPEAERG